jgi:hypothetical protein
MSLVSISVRNSVNLAMTSITLKSVSGLISSCVLSCWLVSSSRTTKYYFSFLKSFFLIDILGILLEQVDFLDKLNYVLE